MKHLLFYFLLICSIYTPAQIQFKPDTTRSITLSELFEHKVKNDSIRKEKPFVTKEIIPEFKGGKEELQKFVEQNLKYKKEYSQDTLVTEVIIRFVVEKTGEINHLKIMKGEETSFAKNAAKTISMMPKWYPGRPGGMPQAVYATILFRYNYQSSRIEIVYPYPPTRHL